LIHLSKAGFFNQIKYLNLRGCIMVTDRFMKYLTGCNSETKEAIAQRKKVVYNIPYELKSLDIGRCSVTDKSLEYIARLVRILPNSIQRLSLRSSNYITDVGLKFLAYECQHLQHLNVSKCPKITSNSLREIKYFCKNCIIQHTSLSFC
jgi:F-box/leucine-rich repeat protein 7